MTPLDEVRDIPLAQIDILNPRERNQKVFQELAHLIHGIAEIRLAGVS